MKLHRESIIAELRELDAALAATDDKIDTDGGLFNGDCTAVEEHEC